jgi:ribonucleoside-diphosphate reductase beta chain
VAENAVSKHITPFADAAREATLASQESLVAWVFYLQRRDEDRHALFFDRIAPRCSGCPEMSKVSGLFSGNVGIKNT